MMLDRYILSLTCIDTSDKTIQNKGIQRTTRDYHSDEVVNMNAVSIRYGERTILKELSWQVMNGERWALSGQNGAGKSTLLSLVCADNPQSYACDISLFGYKRGSGESIWDIKKHIGYVSPEMHRAYHRDIKALKIVASGLSDTVGLYMKPDEEQTARCLFWMNVFGVGDKAETSFLKMSDGEQRLVLLARAFVKDPELLILDEPLHGLDDRNRRLVKDVINAFCERENKTLVMVTIIGFILALELNNTTYYLKFKYPSQTYKFSNILGYYPSIIHRLPTYHNLSISQKSASSLLDLI